MIMSNSKLATYTKISPNKSAGRKYAITRITPHCVVGQVTVERICDIFAPTSREASSNYVIGCDGKIGLCVEEKDRSWCSSSSDNDNRAVTIECASDTKHPYAMNDKVYNKLVELCVDICKRNEKTKLLWIADKEKALAYKPKTGEMLITVHRWFAAKACPGDWLYHRLDDLAKQVTEKLNPKKEESAKVLYKVQAGAYSKKANAEDYLKTLKKKGFSGYVVKVGSLYKVQLGSYSTKKNADNLVKSLESKGIKAFVVKVNA